MKTIRFFESGVQSVPQNTAWYLADQGRKKVMPLKEVNKEGNN